MKTTIVLLHGLGRKKSSMQQLEKHLQGHDFSTLNLGYDSTNHPIDALEETLFNQLPEQGVISFVGHSLGGVLSSRLMKRLPKERQGKLVLLGTPINGAQIARSLSEWWIGRHIFGPALSDLQQGTATASVPTLCVTGTGKHVWYMPGPYIHLLMRTFGQTGDGTVLATEAVLPNATNVSVKAGHSFIMNNEQAQAATREFLLTES